MTTMNEARDGDDQAVTVAPVSFLVTRGPHVGDHRVPGPDGTRLAICDRWPDAIADREMAATIEVPADGVKVFLAYRMDFFSDQAWSSFAALPTIVSLFGTPPLAWFVTDHHGIHARAPVGLDLLPAEGRALQVLLAKPQSLQNAVTLFGIAGGVIRSIKVGLALEGLWRMLAGAAAVTPSRLPEQELLETLQRYGSLDAGVMFAQAMQLHLQPRAR